MELITPGLGLIFWMTLVFLALLFLLKKFAWIPILKALKDREDAITDALTSADRAKEEMKQLKFSNELLLAEAKNERDNILNEARKIKEKIIEEARAKASEEAGHITASALENIRNEKMSALTELKNEVGQLSIEVATKLLRRELSDPKKQEDFARQLLDEIKLN
ncbi:MAG: F0F1 ATP synthase subunit B [Bacteroidota bacterium]